MSFDISDYSKLRIFEIIHETNEFRNKLAFVVPLGILAGGLVAATKFYYLGF